MVGPILPIIYHSECDYEANNLAICSALNQYRITKDMARPCILFVIMQTTLKFYEHLQQDYGSVAGYV